MNQSVFQCLDLEIDLTLNCDLDFSLIELDAATWQLLTEAESWRKELQVWIEAVRSDINLACPEVVRLSQDLSIGLQFTDDETIAQLNAAWRHKPIKTDVLSFPALDETIVLPINQCVELGDIVVSVQRAQFQAKQQNHELASELRWLVSHGLLHLLGWDHPNQNSLDQMLRYQERLLNIKGNVQDHGD